MSVRRRRVLAVSSGVLVVLSAVAAALINQLGGGWGWWVAAGAAVLVWAVATAVMTFRTGAPASIRVAEGGVYAGGDIRRGVTTRTAIAGSPNAVAPPDGEGIHIGRGAAFAEGDIEGPVLTETTLYADPDSPSATQHDAEMGAGARSCRGRP